jgi:hypothetical protein
MDSFKIPLKQGVCLKRQFQKNDEKGVILKGQLHNAL